MIEYPDFKQNDCSRIAVGVYKIGHDSTKLGKLLAYYDRSYNVNMKYFELMGSVLTCLNEISWW